MNKEQEFERKIKKAKEIHIDKFGIKRRDYSKLRLLKAELKGYQEAREEFSNKLEQLKKELIKGNYDDFFGEEEASVVFNKLFNKIFGEKIEELK